MFTDVGLLRSTKEYRKATLASGSSRHVHFRSSNRRQRGLEKKPSYCIEHTNWPPRNPFNLKYSHASIYQRKKWAGQCYKGVSLNLYAESYISSWIIVEILLFVSQLCKLNYLMIVFSLKKLGSIGNLSLQAD